MTGFKIDKFVRRKIMSEISFKAQIKNIKSDYLKTMFENKTAADLKHSLHFQKSERYTEDTFTLFKNGIETAVHQTEFHDADSAKSLEKLFSIFEILKIKEAENTIKKMKEKSRKNLV